jgi:PA14 domain
MRTLPLVLVLACAAGSAFAQSVTLQASASPAAGQAGVTVITVTGGGFPAGSILASATTVTLESAINGSSIGTPATSVVTVVGTTRRVSFVIPSAILISQPTIYYVTVAGKTATGVAFGSVTKATLTVNPGATVTLTPNTAQSGYSQVIQITGTATNFVTGATMANLGAGVSVGGSPEGEFGPITVTSPTQASMQVAVNSAVTPGVRDILVRTGTQEARTPGAFTIVAGGPGITALAPNGCATGTTTPVAVTGINLTGSTFAIVPAAGGTVVSAVISNSTSALLIVSCGQPGQYDVVATQPNGTSPTGPLTHFMVQLAHWDFSLNLSILNTRYQSGAQSVVRQVSILNATLPQMITAAYSPLVSILNQIPAGPLSLRKGGVPARLSVGSGGLAEEPMPDTLVAGQTIRIVPPSGVYRRSDLWVNGRPYDSRTEAPHEYLFTAPAQTGEIDLSLLLEDTAGGQSLYRSRPIIQLDRGGEIAGDVSLAGGTPGAGVALDISGDGLMAEYFDLTAPLSSLQDLNARKADRTGVVSALNLRNPGLLFGTDPRGIAMWPDYAARFHGRIRAEADGEYAFYLEAHARAVLRIDGQIVAEAAATGFDALEAAGSIRLPEGWHDIEVVQYEGVGGANLALSWKRPGQTRETVTPESLSTGVWKTTATGEDGAFRISGLPAAIGSWHVVAGKPGSRTEARFAPAGQPVHLILE